MEQLLFLPVVGITDGITDILARKDFLADLYFLSVCPFQNFWYWNIDKNDSWVVPKFRFPITAILGHARIPLFL